MSDTYRATQNNENLEPPRPKDYGNGMWLSVQEYACISLMTPFLGTYLDHHEDPDVALRKIQTSGSISISPELFEKIYLSPQNKVAGDLRKTFANPTPLYVQ